MKIIRTTHGRGADVHVVELTAEETKWPDAVLITMADRKGNADEAWDVYSNRKHPRHFGGIVRREENQRVVIEVYTD